MKKAAIALTAFSPHVAGRRRGGFNHRFAQPSRDAQPTSSIFTDRRFPFTEERNDPSRLKTGGLLGSCIAEKKFSTGFSSRTLLLYWGRRLRSFKQMPSQLDAHVNNSVVHLILRRASSTLPFRFHRTRTARTSQLAAKHRSGSLFLGPMITNWERGSARHRSPPRAKNPTFAVSRARAISKIASPKSRVASQTRPTLLTASILAPTGKRDYHEQKKKKKTNPRRRQAYPSSFRSRRRGNGTRPASPPGNLSPPRHLQRLASPPTLLSALRPKSPVRRLLLPVSQKTRRPRTSHDPRKSIQTSATQPAKATSRNSPKPPRPHPARWILPEDRAALSNGARRPGWDYLTR